MPPETVWSQRGSIAADGHAALIARLSSLCDGCPAYTEQLHYHDRVYTAEKATRTQGSVSLRAREHLNTGESELVPSLAAFVEAMGLEYDRELLRKGLATEGDVSTAELINSYYLVEASGTGAEEKVVPSLDSLMAQLKPLVHLQPWG
eukprot:gene701-28903_t